MKIKRKKVGAVFLLIILCSFFVSVAVEPFWYGESVQADTMNAAPQLAVQTVSLEQTALQIRINATLPIFLAAVAVILAAGSQPGIFRNCGRYIPGTAGRLSAIFIRRMEKRKTLLCKNHKIVL